MCLNACPDVFRCARTFKDFFRFWIVPEFFWCFRGFKRIRRFVNIFARLWVILDFSEFMGHLLQWHPCPHELLTSGVQASEGHLHTTGSAKHKGFLQFELFLETCQIHWDLPQYFQVVSEASGRVWMQVEAFECLHFFGRSSELPNVRNVVKCFEAFPILLKIIVH